MEWIQLICLLALALVLFLLVPCGLQVLLLRLTRRRGRLLRWVILLAAGFFPVQAALLYVNPRGAMFRSSGFLSMDNLVAAILILISVLILAGWGLGWLLFSRSETREKQGAGRISPPS